MRGTGELRVRRRGAGAKISEGGEDQKERRQALGEGAAVSAELGYPRGGVEGQKRQYRIAGRG